MDPVGLISRPILSTGLVQLPAAHVPLTCVHLPGVNATGVWLEYQAQLCCLVSWTKNSACKPPGALSARYTQAVNVAVAGIRLGTVQPCSVESSMCALFWVAVLRLTWNSSALDWVQVGQVMIVCLSLPATPNGTPSSQRICQHWVPLSKSKL